MNRIAIARYTGETRCWEFDRSFGRRYKACVKALRQREVAVYNEPESDW